MTDDEIAEVLVTEDIGDTILSDGVTVVWGENWWTTDLFVRDPRVAMACMQSFGNNSYHIAEGDEWSVTQQGYGKLRTCSSKSLPRAITEAFAFARARAEDQQ